MDDDTWYITKCATLDVAMKTARDATEAMTGYAIWDVTKETTESATMGTTMSTTRGVRAMLDE